MKKSAFCQHIVDFDHFIAWDEAKIQKIEANYSKRCPAESFFVYQRVTEVHILNRTDGASMLVVYCVFMD